MIGYASIDSTTSIPEFHGVDATSTLSRPIVSPTPGMGGIAHLTAAVAATGPAVAAVSWVGPDGLGSLWRQAVGAVGTDTTGVVVSGSRSPAATLIEVGTGGTICFFDHGDCHTTSLTAAQTDIVTTSEWVLLTVAPGPITRQVLDVMPASTRLAWAVKHDDEAYTSALVRRLLERADVVSFSRAERAYVSIDGIAPERRMRPGAVAIETRGADGVSWSIASREGATRQGFVEVEKVSVDDTTGAGDTFIGSFVGRLSRCTADPTDAELADIAVLSAAASGDLLRTRTTLGDTAGAPHKENH